MIWLMIYIAIAVWWFASVSGPDDPSTVSTAIAAAFWPVSLGIAICFLWLIRDESLD